MTNESLTRKEKYTIIKKFRKLSFKSVCERAGISKQAIYLECLSDKNLDKVLNIINEDIVNICQK